MYLVFCGAACLLLGGAVLVWRVPAEFVDHGRISGVTFLAGLVTFGGSVACTLVAAWLSTWPVPIPGVLAWLGGGALALAGASFHLAARLQFGSTRLAWGLAADRLVTSGVYRYSRNPQLVGISLLLFGLAIVGRSGAALVLAALFWLCCLVSASVEERILEARYGEPYRQYKSAVPRFFGFPGRPTSR